MYHFSMRQLYNMSFIYLIFSSYLQNNLVVLHIQIDTGELKVVIFTCRNMGIWNTYIQNLLLFVI